MQHNKVTVTAATPVLLAALPDKHAPAWTAGAATPPGHSCGPASVAAGAQQAVQGAVPYPPGSCRQGAILRDYSGNALGQETRFFRKELGVKSRNLDLPNGLAVEILSGFQLEDVA